MKKINLLQDALNLGDYVVIQQNPPGDGIGHIVVLVGHDPNRGFKVKSSDENAGTVEWIPENRMTWYQSVVTKEEYEIVKYKTGGTTATEKIDQNGQRYFLDRNQVVKSLMRAHKQETGIMLNTNFSQRNQVFLNDFGFVLKFKKTCQCTGNTCKHTLEKNRRGRVTGVKFE